MQRMEGRIGEQEKVSFFSFWSNSLSLILWFRKLKKSTWTHSEGESLFVWGKKGAFSICWGGVTTLLFLPRWWAEVPRKPRFWAGDWWIGSPHLKHQEFNSPQPPSPIWGGTFRRSYSTPWLCWALMPRGSSSLCEECTLPHYTTQRVTGSLVVFFKGITKAEPLFLLNLTTHPW